MKLGPKSKVILPVALVGAMTYQAGCSSSDSSSSAAATSTVSTEEVSLETPTPAGVLALSLNAIDDTLDVNALDDSVSSLRLAPVEVETTSDQADVDSDGDGLLESSAADANNYEPDPDMSECSQYAEPMANSTTILSEQDDTYPKAKIDCLISTPNASEALAGSLGQLKGILCAFENAIGEPIEFLPSPGKVYEDVAVTIDTNCFTAAQVESMTEDGGNQFNLNITATLDETKSFPNRLVISLGDGPLTIDLLITEDVFSFAKIEANDSSEPNDVTIVTMERGAGIVRAIRKSPRWGETVSLLVTGDIAEDGTITKIDRKEASYGKFAYPESEGNALFNGTFVTAKGDNANGVEYKYVNYRCGQYGEAISSVTGPCSDIETGAFTNRRTYCDARGAESCLIEAPTVDGDALPFFAVYDGFTYTNPQQADIDSLLETPEVLCFDDVAFTSNPNASCDGSTTALTLAAKPKSVNFRRTAQNSGTERRISDWTENCGDKQGQVALEYMIGGTRSIGTSLISALNSGTDHKVAFNIMTPFGQFYSDYDITVDVYKNDTKLATQQLTTPSPVAQPDMVEIPITLGGFTADDALKLTVTGTFTCAKDASQSGRAGKAYSMTWTPGGPRILYQP